VVTAQARTTSAIWRSGITTTRAPSFYRKKFKNGLTPDVKKQVFERLRPLETKVCSFDKLPEQQLYSIWTRESHVCDEKRSRENGAP
jgi:hypothetical protein